MLSRPDPPQDLSDPRRLVPAFRPAPELAAWATASFIAPGAPLLNPDHRHLRSASIGFLWTSAKNRRGSKSIVGTAEIFRPKGGAWQIGRQEQQLREWFGTHQLDFLITIDAVYANMVVDLPFCALIEHELYHCAQALDQWGAPKFSRQTGRPMFALHPHDAEEFIGVVRRYGIGGAAAGVRELVEAARQPPSVGPVEVALACGTCLRKVA